MLYQVLVWLILSFSGYLFNVCLFPLEGKLLEAEFMPALLTAVLPAPSKTRPQLPHCLVPRDNGGPELHDPPLVHEGGGLHERSF